MAKGRCRKYRTAWNPVTGGYERKCASRSRGTGSLGGLSLGSFGQAGGMKATFNSVKGVLITGMIAVGGAFVTERVYDKIGAELKLAGWKADLAEMATGVVLGLLIGKLLKRPKLAAAFAIGPVVNGGMKLFTTLMAEAGSTHGVGLTAFQPVTPYSSMYAPLYGTEFTQIPGGAYRQAAQPPTVKSRGRRRFNAPIAAGY